MTVEFKEMEVLSLKEEGELWVTKYEQMPLSAVQAILVSFFSVQVLLLSLIMYYMIKFAQCGIYWSNKQ